MKNIISPSLLGLDESKLDSYVSLFEKNGCEYIHWDIMDGIFVPPVSFSPEIVKNHKSKKLINDVHIMVMDPKKLAIEYRDAGADIVTFHIEAVSCPKCIDKIVNSLKEKNVKVGISLNPETRVKKVLPFLGKMDLVLVMSVHPGYGGQKFINSSLRKIKKLRKFIDKNNLETLIEVDGGINEITGQKCRKAGADILVAGSYLVKSENIEERIKTLR